MSESDLAKLTEVQRKRFKNERCLKCGSRITTQEWYGSFCHKCNITFREFENIELQKMFKNEIEITADVEDKLLFKFLRRETFVFR